MSAFPDRVRVHRILTRPLLIAVALCAAACGSDAPREPYTHVFPTKEAAAEAVLDAIAARDAARLERLAVTAAEFRKNVWPHLPSSRPEVGMPVEYVWADTNLRSRGELAATLEQYGGRRTRLVEVSFAGAVTDYGSFRVHRESRLHVRDESGDRHDVRMFGSMIETPAGWKVFSYIVD